MRQAIAQFLVFVIFFACLIFIFGPTVGFAIAMLILTVIVLLHL